MGRKNAASARTYSMSEWIGSFLIPPPTSLVHQALVIISCIAFISYSSSDASSNQLIFNVVVSKLAKLMHFNGYMDVDNAAHYPLFF